MFPLEQERKLSLPRAMRSTVKHRTWQGYMARFQAELESDKAKLRSTPLKFEAIMNHKATLQKWLNLTLTLLKIAPESGAAVAEDGFSRKYSNENEVLFSSFKDIDPTPSAAQTFGRNVSLKEVAPVDADTILTYARTRARPHGLQEDDQGSVNVNCLHFSRARINEYNMDQETIKKGKSKHNPQGSIFSKMLPNSEPA